MAIGCFRLKTCRGRHGATDDGRRAALVMGVLALSAAGTVIRQARAPLAPAAGRCGAWPYFMAASKRRLTSFQFTTFHQLVAYSARLFWYFR